jgi:hypothetical protein
MVTPKNKASNNNKRFFSDNVRSKLPANSIPAVGVSNDSVVTLDHIKSLDSNLTRFIDCFMDKSNSDMVSLRSSVKLLSDSVSDMSQSVVSLSKELQCRLASLESKCLQNQDSQNQAYVRHIKDLEKGHERKNEELHTLKAEVVKMQANLHDISTENRKMRQKQESLDSAKISHFDSESTQYCQHSESPVVEHSESPVVEAPVLGTGQATCPLITDQYNASKGGNSDTSTYQVHPGPADSRAGKNLNPPMKPLFTKNPHGKIDIVIAGASNTNFIKPRLLSRSFDSKCHFTKVYCGNIAAAESRLVSLPESPGIFVLNVGTNDLRSHEESVASIVGRYTDMVGAIHSTHTSANILVCTAPPRIDTEYYYHRTKKFNSELCDALSSFDRLAFCHHDNLDKDHFYCSDGIHLLKNTGVRCLVRNILNALSLKLYAHCETNDNVVCEDVHVDTTTRSSARKASDSRTQYSGYFFARRSNNTRRSRPGRSYGEHMEMALQSQCCPTNTSQYQHRQCNQSSGSTTQHIVSHNDFVPSECSNSLHRPQGFRYTPSPPPGYLDNLPHEQSGTGYLPIPHADSTPVSYISPLTPFKYRR